MDDKQLQSRAAQEIDENLRRVFKQMEDNNLPDRFTDLLRQLKEGETAPAEDDTASAEGRS